MQSVEQDYSALWNFRNRNLTSESPYISTRLAETPDKAIRTLCAECDTQKVLKKLMQSTKSGRN